MAKIGRNEPCPCGSGRKHKRCCEGVDRTATRQRFMLFAVGGVLLAALLAGWASMTGEDPSVGGRIWSAEHGHYHDANGVAVP